jgi:hypothetical protein
LIEFDKFFQIKTYSGVNLMFDRFLIAGVTCFVVFAILAIYAALRGNNIFLGGMLACLAVSGVASIFGVHLRSVGIPELEQKVFVAVDLNELTYASNEPKPEDVSQTPPISASELMLAAMNTTTSSASPQMTRTNESGASPSDSGATTGTSDDLNIGTVNHTEDAADEYVAYSKPITKYVMSDLSGSGGISPIEWEDRLRHEHLSVIEKRYREFLRSQGQSVSVP